MRHLTNFLPALGSADPRRSYLVLVRESFPVLSLPESVRLERISDAAAAAWLARITGDVVALPLRLRREHFSAVVSLTNSGPIWSPVPHVLFQRNSLYYCPYYLDSISGWLALETMIRRRLAVQSMKSADVVVTPSDAMADMIRTSCPSIQKARFRTLYHGFSRETLDDALEHKYFKMLEAKRGALLFYPTHPAPHKGFEVLFEILAKLKAGGLEFQLATTICLEDWPEVVYAYQNRVKELGLQEHVIFMGVVPQRQMGALYSMCDLMVYPSLCESFGFSMIEAMGHSVPIVAADTAVNREMCGNGALYYPALDPDAGADAVRAALEAPARLRLIENGARRLSSFDWSWRRYAREFVSMLDEIC